MSKEEFNQLLKTLNIECNEEKYNLLIKYMDFLQEYNKHTNLTSIIEDKDIFLKHYYDSLTISKVIDLNKYDTLLDIGSGAGFPGIVLKIFYPNLNITLLDSNNKKVTFLNELIKELNLSNIVAINDRAEDYAKENLNKFAIVTSRAVANMRVLSEISLPSVKVNGYFIAMKGNAESELNDSFDTIKIMNGKIVKTEKFLLPIENSERTIIAILKTDVTKQKALRSYSQIIKCKLTL